MPKTVSPFASPRVASLHPFLAVHVVGRIENMAMIFSVFESSSKNPTDIPSATFVGKQGSGTKWWPWVPNELQWIIALVIQGSCHFKHPHQIYLKKLSLKSKFGKQFSRPQFPWSETSPCVLHGTHLDCSTAVDTKCGAIFRAFLENWCSIWEHFLSQSGANLASSCIEKKNTFKVSHEFWKKMNII